MRQLDSLGVHPDIKKLLAVQKVDQELARVRRDLVSLPQEEAKRLQRLEAVRKASEQRQAALTQAEVESRGNEKGLLGADQEIKKLEGRLNVVKNNAEYQATLFQIESVKRERGELEEEGVALLDKLEELRQAAADDAAALAAAEAEFAEFKLEADKLRAERQVEVDKVAHGRDDLVADIPPDLLEKYHGLFATRDSNAVCRVEGEVCTGCYSSVTPNDVARLMGSSAIVQCGSCQRILYMEQS